VTPDVVVIENGGGNVASVRFALERLGVEAELTHDAERISRASHVILPGVGAARDAMHRLAEHGLDRLIPSLAQPVLGICLGMQLLFESSAEGDTPCLGILAGRAERFVDAPERPVPHMGWNSLEILREAPLLTGIPAGEYAYFVHSYALPVGADTLATTAYGTAFAAVVQRGNFHGAQFHPERSARAGARLLQNFLELPSVTASWN
jgi:imidazole glycerol-phosphate synthase subunit HisH